MALPVALALMVGCKDLSGFAPTSIGAQKVQPMHSPNVMPTYNPGETRPDADTTPKTSEITLVVRISGNFSPMFKTAYYARDVAAIEVVVATDAGYSKTQRFNKDQLKTLVVPGSAEGELQDCFVRIPNVSIKYEGEVQIVSYDKFGALLGSSKGPFFALGTVGEEVTKWLIENGKLHPLDIPRDQTGAINISTSIQDQPTVYVYPAVASVMDVWKDSFAEPHGLAMGPSGRLYLLDGSSVVVLDATGQRLSDVVPTIPGLKGPRDLAVAPDGTLFVANTEDSAIIKVSPDGTISRYPGFGEPQGLALDAHGTLFIADAGKQRIYSLDAAGTIKVVAGSGARGLVNGSSTSAEFNSPMDVAVDSHGNVYVAELNNHDIRKIDTDGTVTTYAGDRQDDLRDGVGTDARFANPCSLAIDADDNLYVADYANVAIRKIDRNRNVTTHRFLGNARWPDSLALGTDGYVYLSCAPGETVYRYLSSQPQ